MCKIDELRFCYAFDKHDPEHKEHIICVSIPKLEANIKTLKAIIENVSMSDKDRFDCDIEIVETESAIAEAKRRLAEAEGHVQGSLF